MAEATLVAVVCWLPWLQTAMLAEGICAMALQCIWIAKHLLAGKAPVAIPSRKTLQAARSLLVQVGCLHKCFVCMHHEAAHSSCSSCTSCPPAFLSPGPTNQPGRVDALSSHKVLAVAAGREHALVVTAEGEVFSWGGGEAVLGRQGPRGLPGLVTGTLDGEFVRHVAAGEVSRTGDDEA